MVGMEIHFTKLNLKGDTKVKDKNVSRKEMEIVKAAEDIISRFMVETVSDKLQRILNIIDAPEQEEIPANEVMEVSELIDSIIDYWNHNNTK
jgi:hypothetical protein